MIWITNNPSCGSNSGTPSSFQHCSVGDCFSRWILFCRAAYLRARPTQDPLPGLNLRAQHCDARSHQQRRVATHHGSTSQYGTSLTRLTKPLSNRSFSGTGVVRIFLVCDCTVAVVDHVGFQKFLAAQVLWWCFACHFSCVHLIIMMARNGDEHCKYTSCLDSAVTISQVIMWVTSIPDMLLIVMQFVGNISGCMTCLHLGRSGRPFGANAFLTRQKSVNHKKVFLMSTGRWSNCRCEIMVLSSFFVWCRSSCLCVRGSHANVNLHDVGDFVLSLQEFNDM